jgi:hypothetical protein
MATMLNQKPMFQTPSTAGRGLDVPDQGVDTPDRRPGVPMETEPRRVGGAHWGAPERQDPNAPVLKRMEIDELTPVFGTAQPPKGLSGAIRRLAYTVPQHRARRWLLLLMADRVDVIEHRLAGAPKWAALALPLVAIGAGLAITRRRRTWWQRAFG